MTSYKYAVRHEVDLRLTHSGRSSTAFRTIRIVLPLQFEQLTSVSFKAVSTEALFPLLVPVLKM